MVSAQQTVAPLGSPRRPRALVQGGGEAVYGRRMAVAEELEGQTSIEEALADLGEPWAAAEAADGCEPPTLF